MKSATRRPDEHDRNETGLEGRREGETEQRDTEADGHPRVESRGLRRIRIARKKDACAERTERGTQGDNRHLFLRASQFLFKPAGDQRHMGESDEHHENEEEQHVPQALMSPGVEQPFAKIFEHMRVRNILADHRFRKHEQKQSREQIEPGHRPIGRRRSEDLDAHERSRQRRSEHPRRRVRHVRQGHGVAA